MESAAVLPAAVAAVAGAVAVIEGVRLLVITAARGARPIRGILLRLLGPLLVVASMGRATGPAAATTPPPILRLPVPQSGADPESPQAPSTVPVVSTRAGGYTVRSGDSLWAIACRQLREGGTEPSPADIDRQWRRIYEANRDIVGDDPDLIFPGQTLALPEV